MQPFRPLSSLANFLLDSLLIKHQDLSDEKKIKVNPIVTKFASFYEKLRNAMEYREDEVILRASIERILKRRLLLGGNGKTTAEPLIKELLWARYLPDNEIAESIVKKVEERIDIYLMLRMKVLEEHRFPEDIINDWIYDLMSSDIQYILNPKYDKEILTNFMFQVLKDDVNISDDSEETKDAQVFMAVRRSFAHDDLAFLRYHLFSQFFGRLNETNLDYTIQNFPQGYREIMRELNYPIKERIYTYVKRRTAAFLILEDILVSSKEDFEQLLGNEELLEQAVFTACNKRYQGISQKVRRAIIRSVAFILLTKLAFAFLVEGTYDRLVFGHIQWPVLVINTLTPPLLMVIVSLFLQPPGQSNTRLILSYIQQLLFEEDPRLGDKLVTTRIPKKEGRAHMIFNILWFAAFAISFGAIIFVLNVLHFNPASQFIFVFFLTIVSFLSYRISLIANIYKVGEKQGLLTLIVDFFFMPVIRTGRRLTLSIAQINIFLYLFDFFIESPFKLMFAFFDQWFYYLHAKSEEVE